MRKSNATEVHLNVAVVIRVENTARKSPTPAVQIRTACFPFLTVVQDGTLHLGLPDYLTCLYPPSRTHKNNSIFREHYDR